jgi:hypothetical protein
MQPQPILPQCLTCCQTGLSLAQASALRHRRYWPTCAALPAARCPGSLVLQLYARRIVLKRERCPRFIACAPAAMPLWSDIGQSFPLSRVNWPSLRWPRLKAPRDGTLVKTHLIPLLGPSNICSIVNLFLLSLIDTIERRPESSLCRHGSGLLFLHPPHQPFLFLSINLF